MSRKTNSKPTGTVAVSSTPFPKRAVSKLLHNVFENQSLSPIPIPMEKEQSTVPSFHSSVTLEIMKPQKRRPVPQKIESSTSRALKELKEERTNNLCHSRNLYNMHPEPVVLDSDEEDILLPVTDSKSTQSQVAKSCLVRKRKKLIPETCTNLDSTKKPAKGKPEELSLTNKQPKMITSTRKTIRNPLKSVNNIQKNKTTFTTNFKAETKSKPYHFDEDDNLSLFNLNSCTEDEDYLDKEPKIKKDKVLQEKSTPNSNASNCEMKESSTNISCFAEVLNGEVKTFERQLNCPAAAQKSTVSSQKSTHFPIDCVSKFEEIIFKPNRNNGGIVAKALYTQNNDFGYVEITRNQTFSGSCPNVTFVMIEGEVKVVQEDKSIILVPGDMLHINTETGYQMKNLCVRNARLLYIKEHRN